MNAAIADHAALLGLGREGRTDRHQDHQRQGKCCCHPLHESKLAVRTSGVNNPEFRARGRTLPRFSTIAKGPPLSGPASRSRSSRECNGAPAGRSLSSPLGHGLRGSLCDEWAFISLMRERRPKLQGQLEPVEAVIVSGEPLRYAVANTGVVPLMYAFDESIDWATGKRAAAALGRLGRSGRHDRRARAAERSASRGGRQASGARALPTDQETQPRARPRAGLHRRALRVLSRALQSRMSTPRTHALVTRDASFLALA
jgi:hypothetical protein